MNTHTHVQAHMHVHITICLPGSDDHMDDTQGVDTDIQIAQVGTIYTF